MADSYEIRYTHEAADDIRPLRAFDQQRVIDAIAQHLSFEPTVISRSQLKLMTQPFWSQYRLRIEDFRVYYDVDETQRTVQILRVLFKGTGPTPVENP